MRITVKLKLVLAFAVVIALSAITAWLGVSNLASLNETMENVLAGPVARSQMAEDLYVGLLLSIRSEKNLLLAGNNQDDRARYDADLMKQREAFVAQLDKINASATGEGKKRLAALRAVRQQWTEINDKVRALARDNQSAEAIALSTGRGRQLVADQEAAIKDYTALQQELLTQAREGATHQYESTRLLLIVATLVALAIGASAAFWMALAISRGLARAGGLAQSVAGGDLTRTAERTTNDEIGDLVGHVNAMVERLRAVVTEATGAAENVSLGSAELSSTAQELSQGSSEQASAAEQASAYG